MPISSVLPVLLLALAACTGAQNPTPGSCDVNSVCFAIDMSGSISSSEYAEEVDSVVKIARTIAKSSVRTAYSAYGFASSASLIQAPTRRLDAVFVPKLRGYERFSGGTNLARGLSGCFSQLDSLTGNRIIVLLTDGQDGGSATTTAASIKAAGVKIVTVGIGPGVAEDYLRAIASRPQFYVRTEFDQIVGDATRITKQTCEAVAAPTKSPSPTTPATPTTAPPAPTPTATAKPTPPAVDSCLRAYRACGFKIAGSAGLPTISAGRADVAQTGRIVSRSRGERVGVVNKNGVAAEFVLRGGGARAVTRFGLPRTAFKPYSISGAHHASGIGMQVLDKGQLRVARGQCVRVFFTHYQTLRGTAPRVFVKDNKVVTRADNKCVVFRVR